MSQTERKPNKVRAFLLDRRATRIAKSVIAHLDEGKNGFFVNDQPPVNVRPDYYSPETYAAVAEKLHPHNIAIQVRRIRIEHDIFIPEPRDYDRIIASTTQPPDFSDPAYPDATIIWPPDEKQ